MKTYDSNEEFFQAFQKLVQKIDDEGHNEAAQLLRKGFLSLNGLTDGWALLMESIEKTLSQDRESLQTDDIKELGQMLSVVRKTVYRT